MSRVRLLIIFLLGAACAPREGALAGREGMSEPLCWWRNARWEDRGTLLLRGTQVRFGVENLFDSKQKVRDNARLTPVGYQPDLLDPQGRTVSFSIRKLFLPPLRAYRHPAAPGTAPQAPPNPHQ